MNPASAKEAKALFDSVRKGIKNAKAEVVVCPPFVYLPLFKGVTLGAQDIFFKEKGAFTGGISPAMLKNSGAEYVIVGHSERRIHFGESNEIINKKIKAALKHKLTPILCVGEQQGQEKSAVLETQLAEDLKDVSRDEIKKVVIVYEPVWAISKGDGRGKNCSVDETMRSVLFIRKVIVQLYRRELAGAIKILYGGSVNAENSGAYLKEGGVDGLLVGGASLDAQEFTKIVKSV